MNHAGWNWEEVVGVEGFQVPGFPPAEVNLEAFRGLCVVPFACTPLLIVIGGEDTVGKHH